MIHHLRESQHSYLKDIFFYGNVSLFLVYASPVCIQHSRISPAFVIVPEKFLATHSNAKQCGMISVLGTQTALDPVILALFAMLALNAKKGRSL